ncbi:hypothetical protein DH2020_027764 [Rehmannia glutinosa]|uniref:Retrotransposon gag domain-containing protein n=1 Tax=Rehmannia glutinosa TaxID=99300 RepID=A0ABR0VT94_REHGL
MQELVRESHDRVLERFLHFDPPIFRGEPDDAKAEDWLEQMENIFTALRYTREQQVTLAVFRLESTARDWWKSVERRWEQDRTRRTWDNFLLEFRDQYILQVVREARHDKFHRLRQGSMAVAQYESEFHQLSKHALGFISTGADKLYKFTRGLRLELQRQLLIVEMDTYSTAVRAVSRVEMG